MVSMKAVYQTIAVGILFSVLFVQGCQRKLFAFDGKPAVAKERSFQGGFDLTDFKDASLKNLRLIRQKHQIQMLEDANDHSRRGQTAGDDSRHERKAGLRQAGDVYRWVVDGQKSSPLGLVASFPDDVSLQNQAFSYDQALAGMVLLAQKDPKDARKLFDFYNSQWNGHGFYTVYNTQDANGSKVESARIVGPTSWVGLFCLDYYKATGDARALTLATAIGKWVANNVPHHNGGVAMGEEDIWSGIFSAENNISYYALANGLSKNARSSADRALFGTEMGNIRTWLKNENFDANTGLFKRGPSDQTNSFDVNSWALLAFGVDGLKTYFGVDANNLVKDIENTFAVQSNGSFGGSLSTAKGFDFSDGSNAQIAGRSGMTWVEGTNHMVVIYTKLAGYWKSIDKSVAKQYSDKAAYFSALNVKNAVNQNGLTSYLYTDAPAGILIFNDIQSWKTPAGPAVSSSAWVYLASNGINPLEV